MRVAALTALLLSTSTLFAAGTVTTNNNASCDIGLYPAATLLIPYFEVDMVLGARTTIFSITNVSPQPQIARVTLWTDWAYPVLTFNIFLTGYDVQPINLYDVIARGAVPGTGVNRSPHASRNPNVGTTPMPNLANPNFAPTASTECASIPSLIPPSISTEVRELLTVGRSVALGLTCPGAGGREQQVGANHGPDTAFGYATIDVVASCGQRSVVDRDFFDRDLLFDNVLVGDYQQVRGGSLPDAGGTPMVHIRAIQPANGNSDLPFTFYDRYTGNGIDRRIDRRQPLPSTFAARWIGSGAFQTEFVLWREAFTGATASCEKYVQNSAVALTEIVRFDERENAAVAGPSICPPPTCGLPTTLAANRIPAYFVLFPVMTTTDSGGWMYMNLANGGKAEGEATSPYSASRNGFGGVTLSREVSQNWVTVRMLTTAGYNIESDVVALGNGCSPPVEMTQRAHIAPSETITP